MKTNVTELGDSRVRVEVEVEPAEVDAKVIETAERLGREMKLDGFRKGKVPAQMVLQRVGRPTVLNQALEGSLGAWYERAMLDADVTAVGDPKVNLPELPDEGQPLKFGVEVAVRPPAELGEYKGLEVGRAEPEVPAEAVDAELDRLREGLARLNPVERAAGDGDVVLMDYAGEIDGEAFEGGSAKDYLLELGTGRVLPELEDAVKGSMPGDEKVAIVDFPDDYHGDSVAGKQAEFKVSVREVREKELPELDDEFASEASEFETLDELREQVGVRIKDVLEEQSWEQFREAALDAAVANATLEIPDEIVKARAGEMWERVERRLREQGMDPDAYLQAQGKTRDELIAEATPDASRALKREAVLEAVADAEKIEITEEEMLEALQIPPGHEDHGHPEPDEALAELRSTGRERLLQQDLRMRRALEAISENATAIPHEQAQAREQIWTPEKEREQKGSLWTPGSGEPPPPSQD
ncbi:MAG: trigger factor [Actinomycetota bacterium]|nr:trigger factor [Actinomycetota bacterium]